MCVHQATFAQWVREQQKRYKDNETYLLMCWQLLPWVQVHSTEMDQSLLDIHVFV